MAKHSIFSLCCVEKPSFRKYYSDDDFLKQIGIEIRKARKSRNVSIEALANKCEVDSSQIGRMERGEVNFTISNLNKVAKALNIDPKELFP